MTDQRSTQPFPPTSAMETPLGGFLRRAGEGKPVLDFDQFEIKLGSLPEQLAAVAGSPVPPPRVGVPTFSHASGISFPRPDTYYGDPEGLDLFIFGIREWLVVQGVDPCQCDVSSLCCHVTTWFRAGVVCPP